MNERPVMVITGSSKGIGRYLAETYVKEGYVVEGCSRKKAEFELPGYTHHEVDVANERQVKEMISNVSRRHGRIDVLLNNAAIASMNHVLLTPAKASSSASTIA